MTDREIKLGINISRNLGPAKAAVGARDEGAAEEERNITEILVDYFNAHGGLLGRKIVPVFYEYDAQTDGTWSAMAQAACAKFVEDEKVYAVVSGHVGGTDALLACLAKGNTPLVQQNQWLYDSKYFTEFAGILYQPSRARADRWAPEYVDGLRAAGYFDPGAKVGLVRFDSPVFERVAAIVKSRLSGAGLPLAEEAVIKVPQAVSEFGGMNAELGNAILRFRQRGVDHVLFVEYGGIIPFFFLPQAESQAYRPRYGLTSTNLPATLSAYLPAAQLKGAVALSWLPGQDVNDPQDPRTDPAHTLCMKIMRDGGIANPSRLYSGTHCDSFFFLKAALERAPDLTVSGLRVGVERLATSFASPYTFATRFGPGRYDGATTARIAVFDDGCACFVYTGMTRSLG